MAARLAPHDAAACDRFRPRLWRRNRCKRCGLSRDSHVKRPESEPAAAAFLGETSRTTAASIADVTESAPGSAGAARAPLLIHVAPAVQASTPALAVAQDGRSLDTLLCARFFVWLCSLDLRLSPLSPSPYCSARRENAALRIQVAEMKQRMQGMDAEDEDGEEHEEAEPEEEKVAKHLACARTYVGLFFRPSRVVDCASSILPSLSL